MKTHIQQTGALLSTGVDNSEVVSDSDRNDEKLFKSNFTKIVRKTEKFSFLTSDTRLIFTQLRYLFTKAPILQHFDSKYHIQIKIDTSDYTIDGVLS